MSTHRRLTLAVLAAAGALGACQEKLVNVLEVASVQVSGSGSALLPGGSVQLTATPKDAQDHALTRRSVTWSSSNSGVATVSGAGLVNAVGAGAATITAQVEGKSGTAAINVNNPLPTVSAVAPNNVSVGSAAFQLVITGADFVPSAVVQWNGQDRTTQFVNATTLNASITAADIAATGTFNVTVRNPAPGGGLSTAKAVAVVNPLPVITTFTPTVAIVGSGAFELTITGTGFVAGAVVVWNGQDRTTQFVGSTTLKATIGAADIIATGSFNITVRNPAPGGGISAVKAFAVNNPLPVITSFLPASFTWVSGPVVGAQLTITGSNFVAGAVIRWNGQDLPTTVLSSTSVRALLSSANLSVPGLIDITVANPAPGGGASAAKQLVVAIPAIGPKLSAHRYNTCAVRSNGEAYCWGLNSSGQLGDGTSTDRTTPTRVQTTVPFVAITTGSWHSCGLTPWGAAYCWGQDIGNSTTNNSNTPLPVSGGYVFLRLSAGGYHTCGVTYAGELYCWGYNWSGQLGNGNTTWQQVPTRVGSGITWLAVFAGDAHTCGISTAGRLYCWGYNWSGQVGDGSTTDRLVPTQVSGSTLFTAAALGNAHSCALTAAGASWCWGAGSYLGTGGSNNSSVPVMVAGGKTFVSLAAGSYHTCGVTAAGASWCWGTGESGQLGNGNTWWAADPQAVINVPALRDLAAGELHTCALSTTGTAYCWGERTYGALGDGITGVRPTPATVSGGGSGFVAAGAGREFSCGLSGTSARCWGANRSGQLGDWGYSDRTSPVTVTGGYALTRLTVGEYHACGLTSAGTAYCWGEGSNGQLGNGSFVGSPNPVPVSGGYRFIDIDAGYSHTCGVTTTGELRCWGFNYYGQLGDGTISARSMPTALAGITGLTFTRVNAGSRHTCAVTTAGQLYCWGDNEDGTLGDGTEIDRPTPVRVNVAGATVTAVAAGSYHTCAITNTGTYCWGYNGTGELGNGTSSGTPVLTPVLVLGNLTFRSLSLGSQTSCGVTTAGGAYCWGYNSWAQLGTGNFNYPNQPSAIAGGSTWSDVQLGAMHACGVTTAGAVQCWGRLRYGELGIGISGMVLTAAPVSGSLVFNQLEPCIGEQCQAPAYSFSTRGSFARGASGASHFGPVPRLEPARPPECDRPGYDCPLPPLRIVR